MQCSERIRVKQVGKGLDAKTVAVRQAFVQSQHQVKLDFTCRFRWGKDSLGLRRHRTTQLNPTTLTMAFFK